MAVQTNGLTANSPLHYLMDAGAIYKNLTYDALTGDFTGTLLGATSGGNEFALTQETRVIEVDGAKGQRKGHVVIDSEVPSLTINLKELTASNIALAIAGSEIDTTDTNYDIITSKGKIELTDYLQNIGFVARLSGSSKPVVIVIDNAISLEGLTIATTDKNEAVVPVVFTGHEDETGVAPYKIYFPKMV
ncbi:hypothetical protein GCM10009865_47620 [Aeromicrobium ponti]|uniref:Tail tube protein n=1 Tax=Cytobacillus oceanisediminis TaxID=665099 RepID=A0A562JDE4_9BACI|nr:hypothetical protein [Cytobacillus oceanisediminis]TWH80995.1 hypothetical protein IQ19_04412 [Cytobacillus oceanisediminis]